LQALKELFLKIGGVGEWLQGGGTVDTILATVEDYLGEYLTYLQPAFANRWSCSWLGWNVLPWTSWEAWLQCTGIVCKHLALSARCWARYLRAGSDSDPIAPTPNLVCERRLSTTAAGDTVMHYLAGLLAGTKQFSEASSERLDADISALEAFFAQYLKPDKVLRLLRAIPWLLAPGTLLVGCEMWGSDMMWMAVSQAAAAAHLRGTQRCAAQVAKTVQPLHDARGLAAADSVEGFVLGYTSLLEAYPGVVATGLVHSRMRARVTVHRMQCTFPSVLEFEQQESRRHGGNN
jgi:hypothetical protein